MNHRPHPARRAAIHARDALLGIVCAFLIILAAGAIEAIAPDAANAKTTTAWQRARATWYGPGFYGNSTACGQHYDQKHRGVAVPSAGDYYLPCGTRLTICRHARCVRVRVTDTGGFRDHRFDLSARTSMDLCRCWRPYTMSVHWRRGWLYPLART